MAKYIKTLNDTYAKVLFRDYDNHKWYSNWEVLRAQIKQLESDLEYYSIKTYRGRQANNELKILNRILNHYPNKYFTSFRERTREARLFSRVVKDIAKRLVRAKSSIDYKLDKNYKYYLDKTIESYL